MSRVVLPFLFLLSVCRVFAQGSLSCTLTSPAPPIVRAEGVAERLGDMELVCQGGTPGSTTSVDITIALNNVQVASRILDAATYRSEALLLIDDAASAPVLGTNVIQGEVSYNQVAFRNVPFTPPGDGKRKFRITNLKGDVHGYIGTDIQASLTISQYVPMVNPVVTVGIRSPGVVFATQAGDGSAISGFPVSAGGGTALTHRLKFSEGFSDSFRKRNTATTTTSPLALADQSQPATNYHTETGFYLSSLPSSGRLNEAGLATQGTRLVARFFNLPAGASLYVTTSSLPNTGASSAVLVTADGSGAGTYSAAAPTGTVNYGGSPIGIAPVSLTNGAGTATWEILDADPEAVESYTFGVMVVSPQSGAATVVGGLGPIGALTAPNAPAPMFGDTSGQASTCAASPCLTASPGAISLTYQTGGAAPLPITIQLGSSGAALPFAVTALQNPDGWLSVIPASGSAPGTIQVSVNPGNLYPNVYRGTIEVSSGAQIVDIPILLSVVEGPTGTVPLGCSAAVANPTAVRIGNLTESVGDVTMTCTGGLPTAAGAQVPRYDITVSMSGGVPITNRTYANGWSDVMLIVDEPNTPWYVGNAPAELACDDPSGSCNITGTGNGVGTYSGATGRPNVFPGKVSGNQVVFPNVPIDAPGSGGIIIGPGVGTGGYATARVFRITNLRVDTTNLNPGPYPGQTPVIGDLRMGSIAIQNPVQTFGFLFPALTFDVRLPDNSGPTAGGLIKQCGSSGPQRAGVLRFTEGFANTFKQRTLASYVDAETSPTPAVQNVPGMIYNGAESVFYAPALSSPVVDFSTVGLANFGTRLRARIDNVPSGARVFVSTVPVVFANGVPGAVTNGLMARLVVNETGAFAPAAATTTLDGIAATELPVANGSATAVWEVLRTNPNAFETGDFLYWVQPGTPSATPAIVSGWLAPAPPAFADSGSHAASMTLPVPRYGANNSARTLFQVGSCSAIAITTPSTLPSGAQFSAYSTQLAVTGGVAPLVFDVTNGSLPAGIRLTRDGLLMGIPQAAGIYSFTIAVMDNNGSPALGSDARVFSLTVSPAADPGPPKPVSAILSTTGTGGTFTFEFNHPRGLADVQKFVMQFASSGAGNFANSCVLQIFPVATGSTWDLRADLLNDAGSGVVGSTMQNSQCQASQISQTAGLYSSRVTIHVEFLAAFRAQKNIYMLAQSFGGESSGYLLKGSWTTNPASLAAVSTMTLGQRIVIQAALPRNATGKVTFYDGVTVLGSSSVLNDTGAILVALPAGARKITAYYSGDATNPPLWLAPITIQVNAVSSPGLGTGTTIETGTTALQVIAADLNLDGKMDLIAVTAAGLFTRFGNGDGTFRDGASYPVTSPNRIAVGDFDGDPYPDVAVTGGSGVSLFFGTSSGALRAGATNAVPSTPQSIVAGDFNHDGITDLATGSASSGDIAVLLGRGDGTFVAPSLWPSGSPYSATALALTDLDGDGNADLVAGSYDWKFAFVLLGNGDGTFRQGVRAATAGYAGALATDDFNGDGKADVVVSSGTAGLSMLLGNGDSGFLPAVTFNSSQPLLNAMASGDINGDGKIDLAVSNLGTGAGGPSVDILSGKGDGTFQAAGGTQLASPVYWLAVADFNGDGRSDVVCAAGTKLAVLLGVGPTLTISKTHSGDFTKGQTGTYTIAVANAGPGATSGTVTVTDNPPAGMTVTGMSGAGWTCGGNNCTRDGSLAGGMGYAPITVTVNVAASAGSPLVNSATVSGGGSSPATAMDSTTAVAPPITVSLSPRSATLGPGQAQAFTPTVTNASNSSVTWSLSPNLGTITPGGMYTAPATIAAPQTVIISAISVADSSKAASSAVVLLPGAPGSNLALGKPATQSSVAYSGDPSRAVDGNTDGDFLNGSVTHTDTSASPWWQVDLGASAKIESIVIWNRTDCCADRLQDYWVFVSDTPFSPTDTPATLQGRAGTWALRQTSYPNPASAITVNAQGRHVRVQLNGTQQLSLAEAQVFGGPPVVTINVAPRSATLGPGQSQAFQATLTNASNTAVTWSLTPNLGSITAGGVYTAPAAFATAQTVTVTATSVADPTKTATATVALAPYVSGTNLALGKTATQSSVDYLADASRAVDGNTNGVFSSNSVTHTGMDKNAWWDVDLGASANVGSIVIWNRTDCCAERMQDYWVFVSNTPFGASDGPGTLQGRAGTWWSHQVSYPNPWAAIVANTQGRYVRVQLNGTERLSMAEVQVFGSLVPSGVTISISPGSATLSAGQTIGFVGTVTNTSNTGVTWSLSPSVGTINAAGVYTAPATIASAQTVAVTATSAADWSRSASATVALAPSLAGTNLALGKSAAQSSVAYGGVPSRAVDGNTDGNFQNNSVTHTNVSTNPWWEVDLGASANVSSIVLWSRTDCCADRMLDYWVFVSNTAFAPTDTPATLQGRSGTWSMRQTLYPNPWVWIPVNAQGRFVRVQLNGTQALSLAEAQVFGSPLPPPVAITVSPSSASLSAGQSKGFSATVTNASNTAVIWSLNPVVGSITAGGVYTAPASLAAAQALTIRATSVADPSKSASANLVLLPAAAGNNLALGRIATESSQANGGVASRAVDGNTDGAWSNNSVTHTDINANAWWQVDLGASATINTIVLWNRTDCCAERMQDYWVFVSNTPFGPTDTLSTLQSRPGTWGSRQGSYPNPATAISVNTQGRYVRVQLAGVERLSLAEVQVFGGTSSATDLAVGKAASQSSEANGGVASRAVDGNTDGTWSNNSVTHTDINANAWWQVDLGASASITSIAIWNRTDCCAERMQDYWVFVSNTPFAASDTPTSLQSRLGTWAFHQGSYPNPSTTIPVNAQGRYVRVQLSGVERLSLAEVQVFGAFSGTNVAAGKATSQSSEAYGGASSRAVDGNTDGAWSNNSVTHTDMNANAWWQVDLGASASITSIAIWSRTDCCAERMQDYWVFVSNTPFGPTDTPTSLQSRPGTWASHQGSYPNPSTTIAVNAQGRYVRVQLSGVERLSLAEVQVFGSVP